MAPAPGHEDLNDHDRLELCAAGHAASDRRRRIVADPGRIDRPMVPLFLEMHGVAPGEVVLDMDASDDPVHGEREGRFLHGHRCLPLCILCVGDMLCCRLRTADRDASDGTVEGLGRIIPQIRQARRGAEGVDCVFGLARNSRPADRIGRTQRRSCRCCIATGCPD